MNNNISSLFSQSKNNVYTYKILKDLTVNVEVQHNPFQLELDHLFTMAARINPKRSFLFVSKVLGKHLAVDPYLSLLSGAVLSLLLYNDMREQSDPKITALLPRILQAMSSGEGLAEAYHELMNLKLVLPAPVSFIGFAETATALGHSMYQVFDRGAQYVHTTRHDIAGLSSVITFEEEHSHATAHRCYAQSEGMITGNDPIILVDDEITTGKTALNIIREIHAEYPRDTYYVASLLDWREDAHVQRFADLEQELNITITVLSLIKGQITVEGQPSLTHDPMTLHEQLADIPVDMIYLDHLFAQQEGYASIDGQGQQNRASLMTGTGRFGIGAHDNLCNTISIEKAAQSLVEHRTGQRTLCLGTEEFMYIPMRISSEMGAGIKFHSTTRSPIYRSLMPHYSIQTGDTFPSPEDSSVTNFVYNIPEGHYDDVFVFLERDVPQERIQPLIDVLRSKLFQQIHIVICGPQMVQEKGIDHDRI